MEALSNARDINACQSGVGGTFLSPTLPLSESASMGESVSRTRSSSSAETEGPVAAYGTARVQKGEQWFVVRALYAQGAKLTEELKARGVDVYCAKVLPSIIFVHVTEARFRTLLGDSIRYFTPYYNHFNQNEFGRNPFLVVPDDQMINFIRVTSVYNEHVMALLPEEVHFKVGDLVRVTQGDFTGVEGHVARLKGQTRVVVVLDGICMVATAYIPKAFLEKI